VRVQSERDKLGELGFRYKYKMEQILDESISCAVRLGALAHPGSCSRSDELRLCGVHK
jgi:hypothetical protein